MDESCLPFAQVPDVRVKRNVGILRPPTPTPVTAIDSIMPSCFGLLAVRATATRQLTGAGPLRLPSAGYGLVKHQALTLTASVSTTETQARTTLVRETAAAYRPVPSVIRPRAH